MLNAQICTIDGRNQAKSARNADKPVSGSLGSAFFSQSIWSTVLVG